MNQAIETIAAAENPTNPLCNDLDLGSSIGGWYGAEVQGNTLVDAGSTCDPDGCTPDLTAQTARTDYSFVADPDLSYVRLQVGSTWVQAPLYGSAAVETGGVDQFMFGQFWAGDVTFFGVALTDWLFVFDYPIAFDVPQAGQFTVSEAEADHPGIVALGRAFGGDDYAFELDLAHGVTGTYSHMSGLWELDYTETAAGARVVVVHLEGDILAW